MNQVIRTPDQHYFLFKLLGYDYSFLYKPEKSNTVTDCIIRRDQFPSSQFYFLQPVLLTFLRLYYWKIILFLIYKFAYRTSTTKQVSPEANNPQ